MSSAQVILLEKVDKLGELGDTVNVKPGYARNYLLPQKKALRATKENLAYFEAQRKQIEADNDKRRKEAEKDAKKLDGLKVIMIRQASETGQLYGSVNSRDIAERAAEESGITLARGQIDLNQNIKTIGLFDVEVALHPEVKVKVTLNIARSQEEAKIQEETGKALIVQEGENLEEAKAEVIEEVNEDQLSEVLEEDALEAEKEKQAQAKAKAAEEEAKAQAKAEEEAEVASEESSEEETGEETKDA